MKVNSNIEEQFPMDDEIIVSKSRLSSIVSQLPNRTEVQAKSEHEITSSHENGNESNVVETKMKQTEEKKGNPVHLKLPHTQGPGGPTIWCIVRSLTLFLHKRLFPGLEPVTFQSHDNNFTSCAKVTPNRREKAKICCKHSLFRDTCNSKFTNKFTSNFPAMSLPLIFFL